MGHDAIDPRTGLTYKMGTSSHSRRRLTDANFKKLGLMQQLAIVDRDLTAPPSTPADGAAYIPAATATGVWAGHEDDIAIWVAADGAYTFLTPSNGWQIHIIDENVLSLWDGNIWTAGIAVLTPLSIADRDLTAPPGSESDGDAYIPAATATGDWAGEENNIAVFMEVADAYVFITPKIGQPLYAVDETIWIGWNGTAWVAV